MVKRVSAIQIYRTAENHLRHHHCLFKCWGVKKSDRKLTWKNTAWER